MPTTNLVLRIALWMLQRGDTDRAYNALGHALRMANRNGEHRCKGNILRAMACVRRIPR